MIDKKKLSKALKNQSGQQMKTTDPNMTLEVNNDKLEQLIQAYTADKNQETLNMLVAEIRKCRLLVPANLNEEKRPMPCMINSKENGMFFPAYTSRKQIPDSPKSDAIINMPFHSINEMTISQENNLAGIAINPFTENLIFKMQLVKKIHVADSAQQAAPAKTMQLTPEQYMQFERRQFEFGFLPKRLFEQGKEMIEQLSNKKEEYIDQLFEEAYQEKRRYPYLPEDFSVMVMNISEELLLIRVDLPNRDMGIPSCRRIYFAWNSLKETGRYLTIETMKDSEDCKLWEINSEWEHLDHGVAPAEGAELQYVIDLLQEKLS